MTSFIVIRRKILEWEWYQDNNTFKLFLHCIIKANWKEGRFQGRKVNRGQFITSVASLSSETGLSIKSVRNALVKLEDTQEILTKTTNKYTRITVVKYNDYQDVNDDEGQTKGKQKTNKRQTKGNNRTSKQEKQEEQDGVVWKSIDDLKEDYKKRTRLFNAIMSNYDLTEKQLNENLDEFHNQLVLDAKTSKTFTDYARHFNSWMKIKIKNRGKSKNLPFVTKSKAR